MARRAATVVAAALLAVLAPLVAAAPQSLTVGINERLMVIAPHPDDETLAAGGLIQQVLARGGSVRVVLITAGDGYVEAVVHATGQLRPPAAEFVDYGRRRLGEIRAAMRTLGGDAPRLQFLGFPDGGLDGLLRSHWTHTLPERSPTTGATDPPYDEAALEPDVPYDGADLRRELVRLLRDDAPTIVALPDPRDRHPDHRATGLFTLLALSDWGIALRPAAARPLLLAYLVHWPGWPPTPSNETKPLDLPHDLAPREGRMTLRLTPEETTRKRAALACYVSQQREMPTLLEAFVRASEPFTVVPITQVEAIAATMDRVVTPAAGRTR